MARKTITSKDIVEKFNISYHTVNYYTAIGIFSVLNKKGNERLYDEEITKQRFEKTKEMIAEGYPLILISKELTEE